MTIRGQSPEMSVQATFSKDKNKPAIDSYTAGVRENLATVKGDYRRALFLGVLLMAVFELIVRAAISKASIGPFEISDLSIIRKALPVIVAFLFYEIATLEVMREALTRIYRSLVEIQHDEIVSADLLEFSIPPGPVMQGPLIFGHATPGFQSMRAVNFIDTILTFVPALSFIAFEIYAYAVQFTRFNPDALMYIALLLSIFYILSGLMIVLAAIRVWL